MYTCAASSSAWPRSEPQLARRAILLGPGHVEDPSDLAVGIATEAGDRPELVLQAHALLWVCMQAARSAEVVHRVQESGWGQHGAIIQL